MAPDIVEALVKTIELKDQSTAAHTWRVVLYARALAERAGANRDFISRLTTGAALHDVGKIDIPDHILQKPGKLTDEEFNEIKKHPTLGYDRLRRMGEEDPVLLDLVRHHHERVDGKGYPDGLTGDKIPVVAQYFAVIDTFDALTSVRPYRREVGAEAAEKALIELKNGIGTRYDADAVGLFADLYRRGELDWVLHYFNDDTNVPAIVEIPKAEVLSETVKLKL